MPVQLKLKRLEVKLQQKQSFLVLFLFKKVRGRGGGLIRGGGGGRLFAILAEGGRLFGGGRLLERGRLFEEIRYVQIHIRPI